MATKSPELGTKGTTHKMFRFIKKTLNLNIRKNGEFIMIYMIFKYAKGHIYRELSQYIIKMLIQTPKKVSFLISLPVLFTVH